MTLTPTENSTTIWRHKNVTNLFDYTTITDRLRTMQKGWNSHITINFEKHLENSSGHTLSFYLQLVKCRYKNIFLKESLNSPGLLRWSNLQTKDCQRRGEFRLVGLDSIYKLLWCWKYDPMIIERTIGFVLGPFTV